MELLLSESVLESSLDVGEELPVMTMGCPCEVDVVVGMMLRTSNLLSSGNESRKFCARWISDCSVSGAVLRF